jgi:hypothetical protein
MVMDYTLECFGKRLAVELVNLVQGLTQDDRGDLGTGTAAGTFGYRYDRHVCRMGAE